jgi:hypothetical protein
MRIVTNARAGQELALTWSQQLAAARAQTAEAIVGLTREFSGIVGSLDCLAGQLEDVGREAFSLAGNGGTGGEAETRARLIASAGRIEAESRALRERVAQSLTHLQFQDRTDQILGHVQDNILMLAAAFAAAPEGAEPRSIDFASIIEAMKASYTTREERKQLAGAAGNGDADELTYF